MRVEPSWMGLVPLMRKDESVSPLSLFSTMWGQNEKTDTCKLGGGPSPRIQPCWHQSFHFQPPVLSDTMFVTCTTQSVVSCFSSPNSLAQHLFHKVFLEGMRGVHYSKSEIQELKFPYLYHSDHRDVLTINWGNVWNLKGHCYHYHETFSAYLFRCFQLKAMGHNTSQLSTRLIRAQFSSLSSAY